MWLPRRRESRCRTRPTPAIRPRLGRARSSPYRPTFFERLDALIAAIPNPPKIVEGGYQAAYEPATDTIHIEKREKFRLPESFAAALLHASHSTGAKHRLLAQLRLLTSPRPPVVGTLCMRASRHRQDEGFDSRRSLDDLPAATRPV